MLTLPTEPIRRQVQRAVSRGVVVAFRKVACLGRGEQAASQNVRFPPIADVRLSSDNAAMTNRFIATVLLGGLVLTACGKSDVTDGPDGACRWQSNVWHFRSVAPPNMVQVWKVLPAGDDVELNGKKVSRSFAISQIAATKDYDPGAYVLLSKGDGTCQELKELADKIDDRFNCGHNYCFAVPN